MPDRAPGFTQLTSLHVEPGAIARLLQDCERLGMERPGVIIDRALCDSDVGRRLAALLPDAPMVPSAPGEPTTDTIAAVRDALVERGVDGIVAVGGGSTLDTGKVARALMAAGVSRWRDLPDRIPPGRALITVPTTAGTGAEVGAGALFFDPEAGDKILVRRRGMAADLAIADGDLTLGLPPSLTAYTGLDALAQAILAFVPAGEESISGQIALRAISLIFRHLPEAVADGASRRARAGMMLGSVTSALAMFNAPPTYAAEHTFAEAVGPAAGIGHGHAVAAFLVPVARYNLPALTGAYAAMARELGLSGSHSPAAQAAESFVEGLAALVRGLEVAPLSTVARMWDLEDLAARCRRHDGFELNPRPFDDAAVQAILACAWHGTDLQ